MFFFLNKTNKKFRNVLLEGVTTDDGEEGAGGSTSRPENDDSCHRLQQPEKRQLWSGGHSSSGSQRRRIESVGQQGRQAQAEEDTSAARGIAGGGQAAAKVNPPSPSAISPAANMSTKSMGGGGGGGVGGRTSNNNNNNNNNPAGSSALADDSQQYCLRWNNHRSNLLTVFEQLLQTEAFTDVTLAVGGTSIKCHKMVLAACSSYFQSLFLENACPHPIVVFKDIQYAEIRAILEYMYRGEVNVAQEQLPSLLKVAEALRVKGLFEDDSLNASGGGGGGGGGGGVGGDREPLYQPPASSGLLSSTSVNVTAGGGGIVGPGSHGSSSASPPQSTSINAHPQIIRSTSGHALSGHHLPVSSSSNADRTHSSHRYAERATGSADHNHHHNHHHHHHNRNKSPSPTSPPERSGGHIRGDPESGAGSYSRHASSSYLYKSPMLSPQGSEQGGDRRDGSATRGDRDSTGSAGNALSMWPPLVMPLHLGAFETALREREQALALYGAIQRGGGSNASADDREPSSGNGRNSDHHFDRHGDNNGGGGGAASKRKRLSIASGDGDQTPSLLRTVLGPHHGSSKHHHHADIPGLFPFRLSAAAAAAAAAEGSGSADDRNHLTSYLPMAMAYAEVKKKIKINK